MSNVFWGIGLLFCMWSLFGGETLLMSFATTASYLGAVHIHPPAQPDLWTSAGAHSLHSVHKYIKTLLRLRLRANWVPAECSASTLKPVVIKCLQHLAMSKNFHFPAGTFSSRSRQRRSLPLYLKPFTVPSSVLHSEPLAGSRTLSMWRMC